MAGTASENVKLFITIIVIAHEMLNEQICESFMDEVEETFVTSRQQVLCRETKVCTENNYLFRFLNTSPNELPLFQ